MGNQMDKVIDGLYVGGFLGKRRSPRVVCSYVPACLPVCCLPCLPCLALQGPTRKRN